MAEVEAQVARLKVERKTIKGKFTRFINYLNTPNVQNDITQLKLRIQKVESALDEFENVQNQIDVLEDAENSELNDFEALYYSEMSRAHNMSKNEEAPIVQNVSRHITFPDSSQFIAETNQSRKNVRLPKVELATFDGSFEKWLGFYDSFNDVIHKDENLSDSSKLHYLRSCLKGEAANIIYSLPSSDENYKEAWKLLIERFNNPRLIVQTHVRSLMELPAMTKECGVELRKLIDKVRVHMRALKSLKEKVDSWDTLLIYIITKRLDKVTHKEWERSVTGTTVPTMDEFMKFLEDRCQILQATTHNVNSNYPKSNQNQLIKRHAMFSAQKPQLCIYCNESHQIFACEKFRKMPIAERSDLIKSKNACFNCLRIGHHLRDCKSQGCKKCQKKHNSLLHNDSLLSKPVHTQNSNIPNLSSQNSEVKAFSTLVSSQALLSTALVDFQSNNGKRIKARIVLDNGSQSNFMTKKLSDMLGVTYNSINVPVVGLGHMGTTITESVHATLYSKCTNFKAHLCFLILPQVCENLPGQFIAKNQLNIPNNVTLADPEFNKPGDIDALLGIEIFYDLLCIGHISLGKDGGHIVKTKLGWIIAGRFSVNSQQTQRKTCMLAMDALQKDVSKFWEIEEIIDKKFLSEEELQVEEFYKKTTRRDSSSGRFIVRLPFNEKLSMLGESYHIARRRFLGVERKLSQNAELKEQYNQFMREYIQLGHMTEITENAIQGGYFMPHHAVLKESSLTTKLRVVFDASAKTDTGISLNNCLKTGPTIQQDIFSIITRFRSHQYVLTADIEKMYRQILVDEQDRQYQQLLYRENEKDNLKIYRANTVTYGTTPAPYLAIRSLIKLAEEVMLEFPKTAEIIKQDFYVDDILTGADTIEDTRKLRDELIEITNRACLPLRKWSSNEPSLIHTVESGKMEINLLYKADIQKTLGVHWEPTNDVIKYQAKKHEDTKVTKRKILSHIAKLYDPIGLLGPVIAHAKVLMQELWKCELTWDESVPINIYSKWTAINNQLQCLNDIHFDRKVIIDNASRVEIHGFSDASERAYGACIYVRSVNDRKEILCKLLCSKSRVAPLKSISLPKLELCGAVLLSRLLKVSIQALSKIIDEIYLWSDSTITLQWIQTQPHILKTFVANRVSEIRTNTPVSSWRHVPTKDNPADFLSRGQTPCEFIKNSMWKVGPAWLSQDQTHWPSIHLKQVPLLELRSTIVLKSTVKTHVFGALLTKYSTFKKLKRIIAYCQRYLYNLKNQSSKCTGPLSVNELNNATKQIIKLCQQECFSNEYDNLTKSIAINNNSHLKSLNPFMDDDGLIRVGGRLKNSILTYNEKHPFVLPKGHHVTDLIIQETHSNNLHSGIQATLYATRKTFWILSGKSTVRRVVRKCVTCFRAKSHEVNYIMGNLPRDRVTQSRPFLNTGIDYCGPFFIKEKKVRNKSKIKIYAAIFVCFATKAIHIELVTDLTTEAFLASLRRFFARRGKCLNIYSDNATNFVGANRELKELQNFVRSHTHNNIIKETLANSNITWHFSPPRSPHFGGLWESSVKSFKHHFYRTIGDTLFTYEELYTYVTEIEAILNSRPITPLSSDPNDLNALCPSHFLIGDLLTSVPEQDLTDLKVNRLSRWQHIQFIRQHFWKRWSKEYLHELNVRSKWHTQPTENIKVGSMVYLKEDNSPPLYWPLGRIVKVHPGDDGIVRVVTVKTKSGIYDRSVKSIAPLPIKEDVKSD